MGHGLSVFIVVGSCLMGHGASLLSIGVECHGCCVMFDGAWVVVVVSWVFSFCWWVMGVVPWVMEHGCLGMNDEPWLLVHGC